MKKDCRMGLFDLNFCMTDHLHDIMHGQVVQFFMNLAENFSRLLKHPIWGDLKNS